MSEQHQSTVEYCLHFFFRAMPGLMNEKKADTNWSVGSCSKTTHKLLDKGGVDECNRIT